MTSQKFKTLKKALMDSSVGQTQPRKEYVNLYIDGKKLPKLKCKEQKWKRETKYSIENFGMTYKGAAYR